MPTASISDKTDKYAEALRRKLNWKKVPTKKAIFDRALGFVKAHEKEFVDWAKDTEGE